MSNVQLVFKQENSEVLMTDSRRLAEGFGALHKNILQKIERILAKTDKKFNELNFQLVESADAKGEARKMYQMTQSGFMHIALTFSNTEKGNAFRVRVIEAFNEMERKLQDRSFQGGRIPPTLITALELITQGFRDVDHRINDQETKLKLVASAVCLTAEHQAAINDKIMSQSRKYSSPMVKGKFLKDMFGGIKTDFLTTTHVSNMRWTSIADDKYQEVMDYLDMRMLNWKYR